MRTVETIVSDLTSWLSSNFRAVGKEGDIYLAPQNGSVCEQLDFSTGTKSDSQSSQQSMMTPLRF